MKRQPIEHRMIELVDQGNVLLAELATLPPDERGAVRDAMNLALAVRLGSGLVNVTNEKTLQWCAFAAPGVFEDSLANAVLDISSEHRGRRRSARGAP